MVPIYIINSRSEKEPFSFKKVYDSARRVGASRSLAEEIAGTVQKEVRPGMKTSRIFNRVKSLLAKKNNQSALRFSLKDGMRKLGPTGFPFEKYIGEIFREEGFKVKTNQYLSGRCLSGHEIDFTAKKGNVFYVGECKYRNLPGERVHTKDVLANYARYLDIKGGSRFKGKRLETKTIMVTNTKFTNRAVKYALCAGIELLGWKFPRNRGLERLIEERKLYPVTILPSLRGYVKEAFIRRNIMLAEDVLKINTQRFGRAFNIPVKKIGALVKEAKTLLR